MAARAIANGPLWLVTIVGMGSFGLIASIIGEFDPLSGSWEIASATEDGVPIPNAKQWRVFLDIKGDYATIKSYWSCGASRENFAEGVMVRNGNLVNLFKRVRMTPELESFPNNHFSVLPSGQIEFDMRCPDDGKPIRITFFRAANNSTLFDLVGWN